jgi:hypothetical protein
LWLITSGDIEYPQFLSPDRHDDMVAQMWRLQEGMSDSDADNLDALNYFWLMQARNVRDSATTPVDDLLRIRGLRPKRGGDGYRGGYANRQRTEILKSCARLQSLFVDVSLEPLRPWKNKLAIVRSRVIIFTDVYGKLRLLDQHLDIQTLVHKPGEKFAELLLSTRQLALLSMKALSYNPCHQLVEKRLARYFAWIWTIRAVRKQSYSQPHRIVTLLQSIGLQVDREHPQRTYARLEGALTTLHKDGLIAAWQTDPSERICDRKVTVEPPQLVREFYANLAERDPRQLLFRQEMGALPGLGRRVRIVRQQLGLTQSVVARDLQLSVACLCALENGRQPSDLHRRRLEEWLKKHQKPGL